MKRATKTGDLHPRLRLVHDDDIAIGPGKAELLELIAVTGSIAAAGRAMGMSYKRAWLLVETMNDCFREPLVVSSRGGSDKGGAELTRTGKEVLAAYRRVLSKLQASPDLAAVRKLAKPPQV